MVLENLSPALRAGGTKVFALLFDMNLLWESYVGVLFQRARVPGVRVKLQDKRAFFRAGGSRARVIRPDIVLCDAKNDAVRAILDTKWKVLLGAGPTDDDLKQMFAYNEIFAAPQAVLLYPSSGAIPTVSENGAFVDRSHACRIVELGIDHETLSRTATMLAQIRELAAKLTT